MVEALIESQVMDAHKWSSTAVDAFEQEVLIDSGSESSRKTACVHIVLNRSSIWCVAVTYYGVIILRQDDLAMQAILGSVLNVLLSFTLKHILNQERPVSQVCSGPGMPSTHAQSISFAVIFFIISSNHLYPSQIAKRDGNGLGWLGLGRVLVISVSYLIVNCVLYVAQYPSVIGWLGLNGLSVLLIVLIIAVGVYFSWLRVLLRYHTTCQVVAGVVVGTIFSVLWFCTCNELIYNSVLWMR